MQRNRQEKESREDSLRAGKEKISAIKDSMRTFE